MTDLPGCVVVECPGTEPVIEGLGVHVASAATQISRDERQQGQRSSTGAAFDNKNTDAVVFDPKR